MTGRLRRLATRPGTSLLMVVSVLVGGLAAASATAPEPSPPRAGADRPAVGRTVPVARADAACPDAVASDDTATRVSVAAPGHRAGGDPGRAVLTGIDGLPLAGSDAPGAFVHDVTPEQVGPLLVRATGAAAPGLAAGQLTRSTNATMRGLAAATCTPSTADAWFVGSGAVVGQRGRVYLTNPESAPAVVDLRLYGPDGPIDAPDARGVTVPPGGQEVRLLDALAPGVTRFAVHVQARIGRVASAVRDLQVEGLTPLGADWVPAAATPSRRLVVPGVPAGEGPRLLQVVAPGESDAIVRLRLLTPTGPETPPGLDVVEVPAGSVAEVDLAEVAAGRAVALELRSDAPVTAGVLARLAPPAPLLGELAYAAAGRPLTPAAPGVVSEARQGTGVTSTLVLAAPQAGATVVLRPLPPATGPGARMHVLGGSVVTVDLATVSSDPSFAVSVTPTADSGPVYAVRQVEETEPRGSFLTSTPVSPGHLAVTLPRVVADLSTGLRLRR